MDEKQIAAEFKACYGTEHGKRVLDVLSNYCFENRSTFVEGNHDKQNVNNGKRAVILYIRKQLNFNEMKEKQETAITKEKDYE